MRYIIYFNRSYSGSINEISIVIWNFDIVFISSNEKRYTIPNDLQESLK
jgi:hypothetical protein